MNHLNPLRLWAFVAAVSITNLATIHCTTIYVDHLLPGSCQGNYSLVARNCSGNDGIAFKTIAQAAAVAIAGDIVLIRDGNYSEQLAPQNSGMPGNYITFANYKNESVTITGASLAPAIWIEEKNYILIDGLEIKDVQRWLACLGSHHIIIRNNTFKNANDSGGSSKTGLFFQNADYNKILDNIIDNSTQDNIGMVQSDYNLIEGNTITRAAHTLWAIKCGSFNVIRKNYFHNEFQKIGEIYDCDEVGYGSSAFPKISSLDDTRYNVVEDNVFAYTHTPIDASPYAGIQYAAQYGIIRRNVFYHCTGMPISLSLYPDEAKFTYGNRIYNNVMVDNHFGGIAVPASQGTYTCSDNTIRNNIFYRNDFIQYDFRWSWYDFLDQKPMQVMIGGSSTILDTYTSIFDHNNIFNEAPDDIYAIAYGDRTSTSNPPQHPLSWWEQNHEHYFHHNLQFDPLFVDTSIQDFHLQPASQMIDAGRFLARTIGSGNGSTTMIIDSAGYFMDGFGIAGLSGDTIQLEGQSERAVITLVNYETNTLTLDTPLTWKNGQNLGLKYHGLAPDIGAFEYGLTTSIAEETPIDFTINVYPNPGTGLFSIEPMPSEFKSLEVYTSRGEKVIQMLENPPSLPLNLSQYPDGFYLIRIKTGATEYVQKVMLSR